ncbi:MAG: cupin domain-containing protein [Woeseiaceae bacterium]
MNMQTTRKLAMLVLLAAFPLHADEGVYVPEPLQSLQVEGRILVDVYVDASNLGSDAVEVAEITFYEDSSVAAPEEGGPHTHDSTEIFYVLEGELIHIVGDQKYVIRKGQVGIVGSGDVVRHGLETDAPVRALVIWVPGGEVDRLIRGGFTPVPE